MKSLLYFFLLICFTENIYAQSSSNVYIQVLGVAQDGGYPHAGCKKECCNAAWKNDSLQKYVVSFALVDSLEKKWWLFEATPDIKYQLHYFQTITNGAYKYLPDGIFITHAHIGHYSGLMELGREVMSTKEIPVYVLPRMKTFLETNGPWSQLVKLKNIVINPLKEDSVFFLKAGIQIQTFIVPHRDEFSETSGFKIITANKKYLFIPDIDKWEKWTRKIVDEVKQVDVALLDATFCTNTELPNRAISEVPHPLVTETIELFKNEDKATKQKIFFIHFNHTNPLLWDKSKQDEIEKLNFNFAEQGKKL